VTALEPVEVVDRIWARDPTIWTGTDEAHWLGWLDEPARMLERVDELEALPRDFDNMVLLGMGGSSLAPEVITRTFGISSFHVLDTTHPSAIRRLDERVDLDRTLFIAASKSGTTLETRCQLDYFLARGGTFAAITDPGTELEELARQRDFAWVVHGEPTIGGRYSALSPFGMVPAALMDVEVGELLERAEAMAQWCRLGDDNPGLEFGMQLGESWSEGRDKVCIDETPGGFGLWAEQLLAESTGKNGKGLVPAPGEDPGTRPDRQHGRVRLDDPYDLGAEFFRWEFATAVAGSILGINPFDQPDVQAAKDRTSAILGGGKVEDPQPESSVDELLAGLEPPQYVAIQAFIDPEREGG
jgi:transaldolase / glucose-6-phosphate isomerase